MGESPCYMHLFPPDEVLPSQEQQHDEDQDGPTNKERKAAPTTSPNKKLARRLLLDAWRNELIGNHNHARRLNNIA